MLDSKELAVFASKSFKMLSQNHKVKKLKAFQFQAQKRYTT